MKRCTTCEVERPLADFAKQALGAGGLRAECKPCGREKSRLWREANRDRHRTAALAWYHANRDQADEISRAWRKANPTRVRMFCQRRRALLAAAWVEDVDPGVVYDRDGGICGICNDPVDRDVATLDHVIPLSRGGEHSYANTQTAHGSCNSRKRDKVA